MKDAAPNPANFPETKAGQADYEDQFATYRRSLPTLAQMPTDVLDRHRGRMELSRQKQIEPDG